MNVVSAMSKVSVLNEEDVLSAIIECSEWDLCQECKDQEKWAQQKWVQWVHWVHQFILNMPSKMSA